MLQWQSEHMLCFESFLIYMIRYRLAASPQLFSETCSTLLERMINTVPSHVTLSDAVQLITAKPMDVQLDISPVGLTLNATLRVCNFTKSLNSSY